MEKEDKYNYIRSYVGENMIKDIAKSRRPSSWLVSQVASYKEVRTYKKDSIPVGRILSYDFTNGHLTTLDFSTAKRILIFGATGVGKDYLFRAIWNRFVSSGGGVVAHLTDVKPETWSSAYPLQEKWRKKLLEHEEPTTYDIVTYYPYFFKNFVKAKKPKTETRLFQLSLSDLTLDDFITIGSLKNLTNIQLAALSEVFSMVRAGEIQNLKEFIKAIEESKDIASGTRKSLKLLIKKIERDGVVGTQFSDADIVQDLRAGKVVALDLDGLLNLETNVGYALGYVAVLLRKIREAKKNGVLPAKKKLMVVVGEAELFIPEDGNPSSKSELLKVLDLGRSSGISMAILSKTPSRIPQTFLQQADYVFLGYRTTKSEFKEVMQELVPEASTHYTEFDVIWQEISHLLMATKGHGWIFIDATRKNYYQVIDVLPPLSAHLEES